MRGRPLARGATVAACLVAAVACSQRAIDDAELLAGIESFDRAVHGQPRTRVQELLRRQAADYKGRTVRVAAGVVASPYTRENDSHIYFGVGYDPADHLFLSAIDPPLHAALVHHRWWASVVKTYPSRQLSYELPVDEEIFGRLRPGQRVTFSCRIAALIRGRSVYCAPDGLQVSVDADISW